MSSYKIEFSATFDVEDEAALLAAARHEPVATPPDDPRSALFRYVTARLNAAIFQMEGVSLFGASGAIMGPGSDDENDRSMDRPILTQEAGASHDKPRLYIRVLGRNEEHGNWNAIGETDDGTRMPAEDFWGVQDIGGGIDAAAARGVELRVAEDVYADMQTYGDAWYPRPKSVHH